MIDTTTESRQQRRARERAEKKRLKKTNKLGYIPSQVPDFMPDAGVNTADGVETHYWFQTMEFVPFLVQKYSKGLGDRVQKYGDDWCVELSFKVDFMDKEGEEMLMPRPKVEDGAYMLTMAFTKEKLLLLADQIDKGAQGTRLTGIPDSAFQIRGHQDRPETVRVVKCTDVYAKGNLSGSMMFMFPLNGKFMSVSSKQMADSLRELAENFDKMENWEKVVFD